MFDVIDGPNGWADEDGDEDSGAPPIVVVTSTIPERTGTYWSLTAAP